MPEAFYISDIHLRHPRVAEYRGFTSIEEHDDAVLESIRRLPAGSELIICGDISTGGTESEDAALEMLSTIDHITLHLIFGNHDSAHPMHVNAHRRHKKFRKIFSSVDSVGQVKLAGHYVLISHFPYLRDRGRPRFMQWRLPDHGLYLICGHTHDDQRFHGREINVAWEAWNRPVSGNEIAQYIARQENRHG